MARLLLAIPQIIGTRGIVVNVNLPTHVMCGVLVLSRRGTLATATLLVRNSESWKGNRKIELESQLNAIGEEQIPLTIEHVRAPDSHYTQKAEGACGVHSIMFAMYLLDTASDAVSRGDITEIRRVMKTRAPPLYALVARRILVYYAREDNEDDFQDSVTREQVEALLDEEGAAQPRTRAQQIDRGRAEREARAVLNEYPVSVRLPGVHGALVSFRFASQDPARARSYVRVDAYVDVNANIALVKSGTGLAGVKTGVKTGVPGHADRCFAFARYCVARVFPGPMISGPVPRVADMITTKRFRP